MCKQFFLTGAGEGLSPPIKLGLCRECQLEATSGHNSRLDYKSGCVKTDCGAD